MKNRGIAFLLLISLGITSLWLRAITEHALEREDPEPETLGVLDPEPHYTLIAKKLARQLPRHHVTEVFLEDSKAEKALTNYLRGLDYDRTIFLAEDIAAFREQASLLDDQLREGHIEFAYDVFIRFKERVTNRFAYIEQLIESDFDVDIDETYVWKRKELPWAADEAEWDELWRKKIKHEYVSHVVNRKLKAEEKEREEESATETALEEAVDASPVADTNGVDISTNAAGVSTNGVAESETPKKPVYTPRELILKKYRQFVTVLDGHDAEWVLQQYMNAFAQAYDSHSSYLSPRAGEDFDISMKLSLTGIGALLTTEDGAAKVVRLIAGGPAERDGRLQPGDKIIAVAQGDEASVDILYWPLYKSVRLIRGEIGTKVVLTIIPASDVAGTTVEEIDLIRDVIDLKERAAKSEVRELPGDDEHAATRLAVIRLPDFYADLAGRQRGEKTSKSSARDVKKLLLELRTNDVDGVLLDLRNNGGGALADAIEMTGHFIDRGPVVQVKGNRGPRVLKDPHEGAVYNGPLVVLVNRQSASASEILAAALQDYGRAVIVGDSKTHGKGTVQSVFPLDRSNDRLGQLKLTTAGFYRINGHSTQLKGVVPDIVVPSAMDVMEIGEEFLPNVLEWTWISQTPHEKADTLTGVIANLKHHSEERRANDERYKIHRQLLEKLDLKLAKEEYSLHLETRLAMVREDRKLKELEKEVWEQYDYDDADVKPPDDALPSASDASLEPSVDDESSAGEESGSMNSEDYREPEDPEEKETDQEEEQDDRDIILTEALYILRDLTKALSGSGWTYTESGKSSSLSNLTDGSSCNPGRMGSCSDEA